MKLLYKFRFLVLLLLVLLLICGAFSAVSLLGYESTVRNAVHRIMKPVTNTFSFLGNGAESLKTMFADKQQLQDEVASLKRELNEAKRELADISADVEKNDFLTAMLELKKEHEDFQFVYANVTKNSTSSGETVLTLNKGEDWALKNGMPVLTGDGLLGCVSAVGDDYCQVKCVTDKTFSVGVYTVGAGEIGLVSGELSRWTDGNCLMTGLGYDAKSKVGEIVRTTGAGGKYPRGLNVGEITKIDVEKATGALEITVKPFTAGDNTVEVMVLTSFSSKVE